MDAFKLDIKRSENNRMLLGVCGGLAEHFGISSKVVRLATLISAAIVPGVSVWMVAIAYLALGFLMKNPSTTSASY